MANFPDVVLTTGGDNTLNTHFNCTLLHYTYSSSYLNLYTLWGFGGFISH